MDAALREAWRSDTRYIDRSHKDHMVSTVEPVASGHYYYARVLHEGELDEGKGVISQD